MTVANPAWNSHSASLFTAELATTEDNYSIIAIWSCVCILRVSMPSIQIS